jgi:hypothetical protein
MRRCLVLIVSAVPTLALVGACASREVSAPQLRSFETVGVISAIGDEFTLTKAGLTGLDSGARRLAIAAWRLDDRIVARARMLLSKHFQVRPVTYRRAEFAAHEAASPFAVVNLLRDDPIPELVRNQASPQGLDAYVVISKSAANYGNRGRPISGVGIISEDAMFGSYSALHALYAIRLIDGHDFKVIDKRSAPPPDDPQMARLEGPSRPIEASIVPMASDVEQNEKLKVAVTDLIERSLEPTLQDLRLLDRP